MTTNFSGTDSTLSPEAEAGLFGDLVTDEQLLADLASEETTEGVEEEAGSLSPATGDQEETRTEEVGSPDDQALSGDDASSDPPAPPQTQEDIDWKKRYSDLRAEETRRMQAEQSFQAERQSAYEAMLAQQYAAQAPQGVDVDTLAAQAQAAGIDPESIPFVVNLIQQVTAQQTAPLQAQAAMQQASRAAMILAQADADEARVQAEGEQMKAAWAAGHPDLTPELGGDIMQFLIDIDAVDPIPGAFTETGQQMYRTPQPLDTTTLDIAYEAVQNPALREVLLAEPHLYETDHGVAYARRQASLFAGTTSAKKVRNSAAELAAAETLGGPSAPPGEEGEELFVKPSSTIFFSK